MVLTANNRFSLDRKQKLAFNPPEDRPLFQTVRSLRMFSFPNQFLFPIKQKLAFNPPEDRPFFQAVGSQRMFSFPNQFLFRIRVLILSSISPLAPNPFEDNQVYSRDTSLFLEIPIWHANKFEDV
ncbi:hypothetical protein CDAR_183691 [Caerostris darwini]|uniref:Uncharacterized protein n=1 Tax=Caerostris darwini TaxID=1538125 RepID=A0AAV4PWX6_9ARAC|nr:hypothetical protein CDAR_183691 [Caerostris darwini]